MYEELYLVRILLEGSKPLRPAQSSQPSVKANNFPQKSAAYRPPHAKSAAAVQAELFGETGPSEEINNALRNKNKREKQREKKAAEAAAASSVNGF